MSTPYRICFRQGDMIVGRDDFVSDTDAGAVSIGRTLFEACSDACSSFDLWQGGRRIDPWRPEEVKALGREVTERRQRVIAEAEERLRDSRWAIASSKRLLERLENLVLDAKPPAGSLGEPRQPRSWPRRDLPWRNLDPEYWRRRAENARTQACEVPDAETKRMLLSLADNYDQLAEKYEAIARKPGTTD